jgi:hypothetical protein
MRKEKAVLYMLEAMHHYTEYEKFKEKALKKLRVSEFSKNDSQNKEVCVSFLEKNGVKFEECSYVDWILHYKDIDYIALHGHPEYSTFEMVIKTFKET